MSSRSKTILGEINRQLNTCPDRECCFAVSCSDDGMIAAPLSVRKLVERSCRVSAYLRRLALPRGNRVLLATSSPHDFLSCFLGVMDAGLIPVPIPPVGESLTRQAYSERLRSVCEDCSPIAAILSNPESAQGRMPAFTPDELQSLTDSHLREFNEREPMEIAFLQYTSGSTSRPRGVMVSHANVLGNCRAIARGCSFVPSDCGVTWLPLYHDMGLIGGVLTGLLHEVPIYVLPPALFIMMPGLWLRAMSTFKGTITAAPTFAYGLCARRVPDSHLKGLDFRAWRIAFVGAEPVDVNTLQQFARRLAPHGFSDRTLMPVYGLAEATLAVTFPEVGDELVTRNVSREHLYTEGRVVTANGSSENAVTLVSAGKPLEGTEVSIVDPDTGAPIAPDRVGEICVRGPGVTLGYWGRDVQEVVLRTGDLGFLSEGELFVCDRIKDLLIVGGRKYFPSDIEAVLASVPGLRKGRIVACAEDRVLKIAAEVRLELQQDQQAIQSAIRKVLARSHALPVGNVLLLPPGSLPRTSSGKIQRHRCVRLWSTSVG